MLKEALPDSIVCTDVALDPYSSMGHDGIVEEGKILNDDTIEQLCKQVICQARAGADVVAPSDMMDGRVGAIRDALCAATFPCSLPLASQFLRLGFPTLPRPPHTAPPLSACNFSSSLPLSAPSLASPYHKCTPFFMGAFFPW